MTAFASTAYTIVNSIRAAAAACSSARIYPVLDTAVLLVVVLCALSLRIIVPAA